MTGRAPAHTAENDAAVELLAGVRCQAIHEQIVGASCVNCQSWARNVGAPFWGPLLAEVAMTRVIPPEQSAENDATCEAEVERRDEDGCTWPDACDRPAVGWRDDPEGGPWPACAAHVIPPGSTGEATR